MQLSQPGILAPVPAAARHLSFQLSPMTADNADLKTTLQALAAAVDGNSVVVGLGPETVAAVGASIAGLRPFPQMPGDIHIPSTCVALWCWLRGDDRGVLLHETRRLARLLAPAYELADVVDAFMYRDSRDLSGYEDGTENPQADAAVRAAIVQGVGPGLDGGSFAAVQRWVHDLDRLEQMSATGRDHMIGRRIAGNEEIAAAPASAHVKRTAQEGFEPAAFVVRRSMPWADAHRQGLVFLAFGHSFNAFEALLRRMVGVDDGITDALFTFTRPETGACVWCPPMADNGLDLRALLG
ncbi:MAG: Dyp-type peroxidase [bacterium]|nr:Dyp-type peroxidase [bacterium]